MKEEKLLKNLKQRRRGALEKAIQLYSGYVASIVWGIIGDLMSREDREEVIADTFVALWHYAESLDENCHSIRGYLAAIARNKAVSKLRKRHQTPLEADEMLLWIPGGTEPEEELVRKELGIILREIVNEMAEPEREIFIRYYYQYERVNEIAKRMEINLSTVKARLVRGRKKLQERLKERGYDCEDTDFGAL